MQQEVDIAEWINEGLLEQAYKHIQGQIKRNEPILNAHRIWAGIYETNEYHSGNLDFDADCFSEELHESIRMFFFLGDSSWDLAKVDLYKIGAKDIILQIGNKFRTNYTNGYIVDPTLMKNLQHFINKLSGRQLVIDAADMSAVKAQITGTLLQLNMVKKYQFGGDMLQYAEYYSKVGKVANAIRIYEALTRDFNPDANLFKGAFPQVTMINERRADLDDLRKEKFVFETASYELAKAAGNDAEEPHYLILDEDIYFHKMAHDEDFKNRIGEQPLAELRTEIIGRPKPEPEIENKGGFIKRLRGFFKL